LRTDVLLVSLLVTGMIHMLTTVVYYWPA